MDNDFELQPVKAQRQFKDKLFRFIFGKEENRQWTLSLYNALNHTDHTDADKISFNTLQNMVLVGFENDVSFLIDHSMSLYEAQSTYNPNMSIRFLEYFSELLRGYIRICQKDLFSSVPIKIPAARFVEFYCGEKEMEEYQEKRLSDHYEIQPPRYCLDLTVAVYNINEGYNPELIERCKPLGEYAWTVNNHRRLKKEKKDLSEDEIVTELLRQMPDDFEIKEYLKKNEMEVKGMLEEMYTKEELEVVRQLELEEVGNEREAKGKAEGKAEGEAEKEQEIVSTMFKQGLSIEDIHRFTQIALSRISAIVASIVL